MGRLCRPERPLGVLNCRQVGRIGTICTPYLSRTPVLHNPTDGSICRFCRSERPVEALNCRQIRTRPSTIEKRGSMDRIESNLIWLCIKSSQVEVRFKILFLYDLRRLILSMMIYVIEKFIIIINYLTFCIQVGRYQPSNINS